ncbi:uncharacterized protein O9250_001494 isoform 1-T2 [Rhynochetos jubatus]
MGSTVSVKVKAVLAILLTLAQKHDIHLKEKDVMDLLLWGQRQNVLLGMEDVFKEERWQKLGEELWESVQLGTKEAIALSQVWHMVNKLMMTTRKESKIMEAAEKALGYGSRTDETASVSDKLADVVALPANVREARSLFEIPLPPDFLDAPTDQEMPSASPPDPSSLPGKLPPLPDSLEPMDMIQQLKAEEAELKRQADDLQLEGVRQKLDLAHLGGKLQDVIRQQSKLIRDLYYRLSQQAGPAGAEGGRDDPDRVSHVKTQTPEVGQKWHGIIRDAIVDGEFLGPLRAYPVNIQPGAGGAEIKEWQQFDWRLLDRLQKAIMEYGLDNAYVRNLIDVIFSQNILTLHDIDTLTSLILSPMQKLVFKDDWKRRIDVALIQGLDLRDEDPLKTATADMLLGQGAFAHPRAQARLRRRILQQSQALAAAALKALQISATITPPYTKIVQQSNEPFAAFLDRLRASVEKSPNLALDAKHAVMLDLAVQNANEVCKRILATLPKTAFRTVADLI